jgi:SAM-dependent methyltransferase
MNNSSEFWDILAPNHAALENSFFDLATSRRVVNAIHQQPVLVVGAGQGLLVEELQKRGFQCAGIDFSSAMVRYAKLRRGLILIEADARHMPLEDKCFGTIIYATGVLDAMGDEQQIKAILKEGRRVVKPEGKILVGFYRMSAANEAFLKRVGLLRDSVVSHRECLKMYLLNPLEMVAWMGKHAGVGRLGAATMLFHLAARNSMHEKAMTFRMQRIFRDREYARRLIEAAPEEQPYRNEGEITNLFSRLAIAIKQIQSTAGCFIAEI